MSSAVEDDAEFEDTEDNEVEEDLPSKASQRGRGKAPAALHARALRSTVGKPSRRGKGKGKGKEVAVVKCNEDDAGDDADSLEDDEGDEDGGSPSAQRNDKVSIAEKLQDVWRSTRLTAGQPRP
jgi:hypothetical protein